MARALGARAVELLGDAVTGLVDERPERARRLLLRAFEAMRTAGVCGRGRG